MDDGRHGLDDNGSTCEGVEDESTDAAIGKHYPEDDRAACETETWISNAVPWSGDGQPTTGGRSAARGQQRVRGGPAGWRLVLPQDPLTNEDGKARDDRRDEGEDGIIAASGWCRSSLTQSRKGTAPAYRASLARSKIRAVGSDEQRAICGIWNVTACADGYERLCAVVDVRRTTSPSTSGRAQEASADPIQQNCRARRDRVRREKTRRGEEKREERDEGMRGTSIVLYTALVDIGQVSSLPTHPAIPDSLGHTPMSSFFQVPVRCAMDWKRETGWEERVMLGTAILGCLRLAAPNFWGLVEDHWGYLLCVSNSEWGEEACGFMGVMNIRTPVFAFNTPIYSRLDTTSHGRGLLLMCNANANNLRACLSRHAAHSARAPKSVAQYSQRLASFVHSRRQRLVKGNFPTPKVYMEGPTRNDG
ncbi:hypothetical protein BJ912DRAFT_1132267 [Pholiota molesta]|nr:hypothetical protein BJ912DRAFT_1132267 [Pholiota molesta]